MDHMVFPQVWNRAFSEMYPELAEKIKVLQDYCGRKIRNVVWDESKSFVDVISGFTKCREDIKWQDRGIPLLRELMIKKKIAFSEKSRISAWNAKTSHRGKCEGDPKELPSHLHTFDDGQ